MGGESRLFKHRWGGWFLLGLMGCASPGGPSGVSPVPAVISIQAHTVLPLTVGTKNPADSNLLQVPNALLTFYRVSHGGTEVRKGPGGAFPLLPRFLEEKEVVMGLESYKKWTKIFQADTNRTGWVHQDNLMVLVKKEGSMTLDTRVLGTVFANESMLSSYPENQKLPVTVPKDRMFFVLRSEPQRSLVWIVENQSVAWLSHHNQ